MLLLLKIRDCHVYSHSIWIPNNCSWNNQLFSRAWRRHSSVARCTEWPTKELARCDVIVTVHRAHTVHTQRYENNLIRNVIVCDHSIISVNVIPDVLLKLALFKLPNNWQTDKDKLEPWITSHRALTPKSWWHKLLILFNWYVMFSFDMRWIEYFCDTNTLYCRTVKKTLPTNIALIALHCTNDFYISKLTRSNFSGYHHTTSSVTIHFNRSWNLFPQVDKGFLEGWLWSCPTFKYCPWT